MPYPAITRAELLYLTVNAQDLAARRSRLNFGPVPWPRTVKQLAGFGGSIRAHAAVTSSSTSRQTAPWRTLARAARTGTSLVLAGLRRDKALGREGSVFLECRQLPCRNRSH